MQRRHYKKIVLANQRDFDLPLAREDLLHVSSREDPAKSPAENENPSRFYEACSHSRG
jgi:hypothetical protein